MLAIYLRRPGAHATAPAYESICVHDRHANVQRASCSMAASIAQLYPRGEHNARWPAPWYSMASLTQHAGCQTGFDCGALVHALSWLSRFNDGNLLRGSVWHALTGFDGGSLFYALVPVKRRHPRTCQLHQSLTVSDVVWHGRPHGSCSP